MITDTSMVGPSSRSLALALCLALSTPAVAAPAAGATKKKVKVPRRSWIELSQGTGEFRFTAVAVDPALPRRVYLAAPGRLFRSDDAGESWTLVLMLTGGRRQSPRQAEEDVSRGDRAVDDAREEAEERLREELLEEITERIREELEEELGEELAQEVAEELAEEEVDLEILAEQAALDDEAAESAGARRRRTLAARVETAREAAAKLSIRQIVLAPGGRVMLATGRGVYVSSDDGRSFAEISLGTGRQRNVRTVAVDPADPRRLFAGTAAGLLVSEDGGATWQASLGLLGQVAVNDLVFDRLPTPGLWVATSRGVYRSQDAGRAFEESWISAGDAEAVEVVALAVDPARPDRIYGATARGLLVTTDAGVSWDRVSPPGLTQERIQDLAAYEKGLVVGTRNGVFVSDDGGGLFKELYDDLPERNVASVAVGAFKRDLWIATARGAYAYRVPGARMRRSLLRDGLKKLEQSEPTMSEVSEAALGYASLTAAQAADLVSRSRWSAVLPRVNARLKLPLFPTDAPTLRRTFLASEQAVFELNTPAYFGAFATWDLSQIVFDSKELQANETFRDLRKHRERVLDRVVNTYTARRRLQIVLMAGPPKELKALAQKTLALEEMTASLDGLTGGYFTAAIAQRTGAPPKEENL